MTPDDSRTAAHYRSLFMRHGDSAKAAQWFDEKTQEKRFEILCQAGDLRDCSLLDFGCGTGRLAAYLDRRGLNVRYAGVDIVDEVLDHCRRTYPHKRFCTWDQLGNDTFDWTFVSGVFNNRRNDNARFWRTSVANCFQRCRRGLAFNMLSRHSADRAPDLYYVKPEEAFSFCRTHLSPLVTVRNDYRVRDDLEAFDFTVYVYRGERGQAK